MASWWWLAQHLVTTALLAAIVTAICSTLRSRPALAHALWVVVLIKFLMPPLVVWLDLLAGVVWWCNPLFWYVRSRLREAAEMACDALALEAVPGERFAYAELFLEISSSVHTGMPAAGLSMSAAAHHSFERRFSMILSEHVSGKLSNTGLVGTLAMAALVLPAWSWAQTPGLSGVAALSEQPATVTAAPAKDRSLA